MQNERAGDRAGVRYEPDDKPPKLLTFGLGLQLAILCRQRDRTDAGHRGPGRRQRRAVPLLGRVRGGRGLRRHHRAAGGAGGQDRRRLRAADGHVGSLHRGLRHGARQRRAGDAGHPGGHLGPVSVRARRAALAVAARADSNRGGDGDHADCRHGDAHRLRHAGGRAGERCAGGRAAERSGDRVGHHRTRVESDGSAPPLGTGHRRGRRIGGRRA